MPDLDGPEAELGAGTIDVDTSGLLKSAENRLAMAHKYDDASQKAANRKLAFAIALGYIIGRQLR